MLTQAKAQYADLDQVLAAGRTRYARTLVNPVARLIAAHPLRMIGPSGVGASLVVIALLAAPAAGQLTGGIGRAPGRYEAMYGTPVEIAIDDLLSDSAFYQGRAVRARGRLDLELAGAGREGARQFGERRGFILRGSDFGNAVRLVAMPDIQRGWEGDVFAFVGREVEVTGVFRGEAGMAETADLSGIRGSLEFWSFLGPREDEDETRKAPQVSLDDLIRDAGGREGQAIRVVGQFRGRNLYGDLPGDRGCSGSDWVIRADGFAVWVTGKKPSGDGWKLDPESRWDTDKWILVVGRPETRRGITCLRALELHLTSAPPEAEG